MELHVNRRYAAARPDVPTDGAAHRGRQRSRGACLPAVSDLACAWAGAAAAFIVCVAVLLLGATTAGAQSISLTPEQQRLLNQLPPSQRAAALQQLRNLRASSGATSRQTQQDSESAPALPTLPATPDAEAAGPAVFASDDTLVLQIAIPDAAGGLPPSAQVADPDELRTRLLKGNPYRLDALGRLALAGVGEISLTGLTEEQATLRLSADPALAGLDITVKRLPLSPVGVEALEPFGYSLFEQQAARLQPDRTAPVAADYVVGFGDTLRIQLYGSQNVSYDLPVERNGTVLFPEIGPISVAGLNYTSVQQLIGNRVREQFIGTQVSVTLGELRTLQVFVVGDVKEPGSYAVDPMSTITTALALSNGVARAGSLRNIQLKRKGELIQTLDVYDLLLRGDTRTDVRLQAGDVVFVPPVGSRVSIAGEVRRPAIYEFRGRTSVSDVLGLAGGLKSTAYQAGVRVERQQPDAGIRIIDADQETPAGRELRVADGDVLLVPAGLSSRQQSVKLIGNVERPGDYEWRQGLKIADLIVDSRQLRDGSDLNYLLIRREVVPNGELTVLSADIEAAWRAPAGPDNLRLQPRDTVYVFDLDVGRDHVVNPLIEELNLRSSRASPLPVASIGGQVNAAGRYPLEPGMRVSDLVRAAGGLEESAYLKEAELARYAIIDGESRKAELVTVDLDSALNGDNASDVVLQPFDYLNIKTIPRWREQSDVEILGEVIFPGRYPVRQGETLKSVLQRAGGVTELASEEGSVFTREVLKEREREQLVELANRVESDLASLSLSDPSQSEAISIGQALLKQLREAQPVGRLVIDVQGVLDGTAPDVTLRDGDRLIIPVKAQEVTVLGEVQYRTSHLYESHRSRDDYIDMSGGMTRRADAKRTYVVRANGEVVVGNRSLFFARQSATEIRPGDTIVVPVHTDKVRALTLWTSATQILYNLAIAAAAINSF